MATRNNLSPSDLAVLAALMAGSGGSSGSSRSSQSTRSNLASRLSRMALHPDRDEIPSVIPTSDGDEEPVDQLTECAKLMTAVQALSRPPTSLRHNVLFPGTLVQWKPELKIASGLNSFGTPPKMVAIVVATLAAKRCRLSTQPDASSVYAPDYAASVDIIIGFLGSKAGKGKFHTVAVDSSRLQEITTPVSKMSLSEKFEVDSLKSLLVDYQKVPAMPFVVGDLLELKAHMKVTVKPKYGQPVYVLEVGPAGSTLACNEEERLDLKVAMLDRIDGEFIVYYVNSARFQRCATQLPQAPSLVASSTADKRDPADKKKDGDDRWSGASSTTTAADS